jgi:tetratricopeptide (TPR) repeat protein
MGMFLQQQIAVDDPRLAAVRAHFRSNLLAIAAAGRRAGASTLLCTVATNQRDFAPFLSRNGEAERVYQEGRAALAAGRDAEAAPLLQRALDLDLLRFRTDSRLNQVIRDLAPDASPSLRIIDVATAIAARSSHGVPGNEFFYEHVHLNLRGTCEVATALFPAIAADLERRGLVSGPVPTPIGYAEIAPRLGYNTYEQTMIAIELLQRFGQAPFTAQSDHVARQAAWQRVADQGQALLARADATDALREISRRALAERPDDWILARNTGAMLLARQKPAEALPLLEQADRWIDDDVDTLVALGWTHRALGEGAAAEAAFARARQIEPSYPNLPSAP